MSELKVSRFIPSFAGVRVCTGGPDVRTVTVPAVEPVRVWHLLTRTHSIRPQLRQLGWQARV